jgi:peptidyl-prolyl cis-trans isomerase SurA
MTHMNRFRPALGALIFAAATAGWAQPAASAASAASATSATAKPAARQADYIVAIVNNELVTQVEVDQRVARIRLDALRSGARLPDDAALRKQVLDALIEERVIVTYARDAGLKVDEPELDRAVANVATANKLTLDGLQQRLRAEGIDYTRFRANLRDQILAERVREREVVSRIKVTDADIEGYLASRKTQSTASAEINIAQILVTVPDNAGAEVVAARRARIDEALKRVRGGEPFELVAKAYSEDSNKDKGGEIGAKPADRLPDLFVAAVRSLAVGGVTAEPLRSGAGFHILKLLSRADAGGVSVTQTRARHILLRTSPSLSADAAQRRLAEFRDQILNGSRKFDDLARQYSEDSSAANGGDLGWAAPGSFVPEFEEAMTRLPVNGVSPPIVSRFGVHLIQVMERRQVAVDTKELREQARNVLREQKFEPAYADWAAELKARAYVEMRDPPQQ